MLISAVQQSDSGIHINTLFKNILFHYGLSQDIEYSSLCCTVGPYLFIYFKVYLFYFWLCWVLIAARGLSLVEVSGGYSLLRCAGFSLQWLLLLQSTGSRCVGFSSCGTQASVVVARGL